MTGVHLLDRRLVGGTIRVKPVGPQARNLIAFVERRTQNLKHEVLNHFVVFGLARSDQIISEYVVFYLGDTRIKGLAVA